MKRGAPKQIDLSLLEFLEYGDMTLIAKEEQKAGRKTDPSYVSKVCGGLHRNDRILKRAFEIAIQKQSKYPKQTIRVFNP